MPKRASESHKPRDVEGYLAKLRLDEKERIKKENESRREESIQRIMKQGSFTRKQAVYLLDNFAPLNHSHNERINTSG